MSRINTPTNQKLLTNVAVVRIKKAGKRFELACYKNKVLSWRQGIEKDVDEVLQSDQVFTNVSKGQTAKKDDVTKAFGTSKMADIVKEILEKGDLQVSDKERAATQDALFKEVANTIADKCVNPENQLPYPVTLIEKAMKEAHIAVKPNQASKKQALEVMGKLKEHLPLERAQMRLKLVMPIKTNKAVRKELKKLGEVKIEVEGRPDEDGNISDVVLVDPGNYRAIDDILRDQTKGEGVLELLDLKTEAPSFDEASASKAGNQEKKDKNPKEED